MIVYHNALVNAFKYALETCKGIILFPTFPTIITLIMHEYSKFRDRSTFEMAGKHLSFWTTGRKNISFLTLKNWKSMYFLPKKAGILSFDRRGHHVLYNELIIQK